MGNSLNSCLFTDGATDSLNISSSSSSSSTSTSNSVNNSLTKWQNHLSAAITRFEKAAAGAAGHPPPNKRSQTQAQVFHALLQLYAHKNVIATELYPIAETEAGRRAMAFYVPQLATFLLHGGFEFAMELQVFFLHLCRKDVKFAHRLFWFLTAFFRYDGDSDSSGEESLMKKIIDNGGESVDRLGSLIKLVMEVIVVAKSDNSEAEEASESESPPLPPPSLSSESTESSPLPLPPPPTLETIPNFQALLNFTSGLTNLSDQLRLLPGKTRNAELKIGLKALAEKSLPSHFIYLPLNTTNKSANLKNSHSHSSSNVISIPVNSNYVSIVGLHCTESVVFSTKERCPFLCTLEVVDVSVNLNTGDVDLSGNGNNNHGRVSGSDGDANGGDKDKDEKQISGNENIIPAAIRSWWTENRKKFGVLKKSIEMVDGGNFFNLRDDNGNEMVDVRRSASTDDIVASSPGLVKSSSSSLNALDPSFTTPSTSASASASASKAMGQWESEPDVPARRGSSLAVQLDYLLEDALFPGTGKIAHVKEQIAAQNIALREDLSHNKILKSSSYNEGIGDLADKPRTKLTSAQKAGIRRQMSTDINEYNESELDASMSDDDNDEDGDAPPDQLLFKESWHAKEERIRKESVYGNLPGWRLLPVIVKSYDDLRQEQMVSQIICAMHNILNEANVPVYVRSYDIIASQLGGTGGLIEAVADTVSIDSLKRHDPSFSTLDDFFIRHFGRGEKSSNGYRKARRNFVSSMAGYAVICYLLQVKDRHNGNILLDNEGHIVHIDWGFVLLSSPGKNFNFEAAPFKLTNEFVDVMGGSRSASFRRFRRLTARAFLELRKRREEIILLVEMLSIGNANLPCFVNKPSVAIAALRERFRPDLTSEMSVVKFVDGLVRESTSNWTTKWYDHYQMCCVGIEK